VDARFSLDGYVVEELLGFGGAGEVWRAREVATEEAVALKRLRTRGPAATERLRREAGLLATVAGPHVIGVRRLLVEGDEAVLVMDFAAGGSLADVLAARGRLPVPEVVTVLAPIAAALAAAHAHDLVHGDITPANILFTADGRPQLADFGVARAISRQPDHVEATLEYADATVAAGSAPAPASDVFALAAVGFAALTGHSVWGDGSSEERLDRARRGDRPAVAAAAPPDTPVAMTAALESMLAADAEERPDARSAAMAILRASAAAPVGLVARIVREPAPVTHRVPPAPAPDDSARDNVATDLSDRFRGLRRHRAAKAQERPSRLGAYDLLPGRQPSARLPGGAGAAASVAAPTSVPQRDSESTRRPPPEMQGASFRRDPDDPLAALRTSVNGAGPSRAEPAPAADFWGPDDDTESWRTWRRRVVIGGACVLGLLGAAGVGVSLARSHHSAPTPAPASRRLAPQPTGSTAPAADVGSAAPPKAAPTAAPARMPSTVDAAAPAAAQWTAIVARLDALRARAFADADPADLASVYEPGAAVYATDLATVRSLVSRGLHAQGFRATVHRVTPVSGDAGSERLRVVDALSGYRLVDDAGDVVGQGAARPPRAFTMRLAKVDGSWRVAAIAPA
jgi:serine/threonine protein kinase